MERDYLYPKIADRDMPFVWEQGGALMAQDRAKTEARRILEHHHPTYLNDAQITQIRRSFDGGK
jgi:trimethylamine--corrinoid protein Co-methyltransferase